MNYLFTLETKFNIENEGRALLNKQLKLVKKGWYLYAPLAIIVFALAFAKRYDREHMLEKIVLALSTMGTIFIFTFIINPLRRLRIINHIIQSVEFSEEDVVLTTYAALWKKEQTFILKMKSFYMVAGATEKTAGLFGQKPCFRIRSEDLSQDLYLLLPFFSNLVELRNRLEESVTA